MNLLQLHTFTKLVYKIRITMRIGFFIFAFGLFLTMAAYVSLRGWQALQSYNLARIIYLTSTIVLFLTLISGLIFSGNFSQTVAKTVSFIGFSYMIIMIYLLLSFLIFDLVRLSNSIFHFIPGSLAEVRLWWLIISIAITFFAMIYGNYRFNHPEIVYLNLKAADSHQNKKIRIVAASDIHLGVSIDKKRLQKYVEMINAQKPDLVLLAGDISDRSTIPLIKQNMAEELKKIHSTLGIYAISGNHEYFSENPHATGDYLKTAGITMLRDSSVLVGNSFYVIGRDDRTNLKRKPLSELTRELDQKVPKILLDHQPFDLHQAQQNGIDLQISGHTHNGQFFPGNLIVKKMYELGHGYLKKGKTHYYVSSGLGIWGPQYRIGTQSELVVIDFSY